MPEFVLAAITDEYKMGDRFQVWPLHITILPPFSAPALNEVEKMIKPVTASTPRVRVQLDGFAQFGKRIVHKIIGSPELSLLHNKILQAAEESGWRVAGRYVGTNYTPHITRKGGRDYEDPFFIIKEIAVVEAQPMGYREIVQILELKG